jgi:hypothetical protein
MYPSEKGSNMSKSFRDYLEESQKTYNYTLRMALEPSDDHMDRIEKILACWNLQDIHSPEPVDPSTSLEFTDVPQEKVCAIRFSLGVPVSSSVLQQDLRTALNTSERQLVVRGLNEPVEIEDNRRSLLHDLAQLGLRNQDQMPASLLSTDRNYLDVEQPLVRDVYGDSYNRRFLEYLADVAAQRLSREYPLAHGHISLSDLASVRREPTQDLADFNDGHPGVKPVSAGPGHGRPPVDPSHVAPEGNFDDERKLYFKLSRDKNNKVVVNSAETSVSSTKAKV